MRKLALTCSRSLVVVAVDVGDVDGCDVVESSGNLVFGVACVVLAFEADVNWLSGGLGGSWCGADCGVKFLSCMLDDNSCTCCIPDGSFPNVPRLSHAHAKYTGVTMYLTIGCRRSIRKA